MTIGKNTKLPRYEALLQHQVTSFTSCMVKQSFTGEMRSEAELRYEGIKKITPRYEALLRNATLVEAPLQHH